MSILKLEISLDDLINDMFDDADVSEYGASPSQSFNECIKDEIVSKVSRDLISAVKQESIEAAKKVSVEKANDFAESELEHILTRKLRSGELRTKYNGFKSFDELIEARIAYFDIEKIINKHIDKKTQEFAEQMKARYDNIFAAKIVESLNVQKLLSPEVSKMLLGDDNDTSKRS